MDKNSTNNQSTINPINLRMSDISGSLKDMAKLHKISNYFIIHIV